MRVFLVFILLHTPLCEGEVSLPALMRKVAKNVKKLVSKKPEDPAYKTRMYCRELAQFTPQLCDNPVANSKCTEICREDKTPPGKIFM